ncbi:MAG: radical SAM protein [Oscillospiraceae bacterium]|nr:radical SAM protein [Oscillospiraceae bacterium]
MKIMNTYVNPDRLEFIVTFACSGKCKHCSLGDPPGKAVHIDSAAAENAVKSLAGNYKINSVMTFGGEPLLYLETTARIHAAAKAAGIPHRQIITNGFFTKNKAEISTAADLLADSGANEILISADAFHQETVPLEFPLAFGEALTKRGIDVKAQPAWLVSPENDNPYNVKTREIIEKFKSIGIPAGNGNVIFPAGNALKYLGEYFTEISPENPYEQDPGNITSISVEPNGNCLNGNILQSNILELIDSYTP